uniref:Uncharacterized protein n=1 Tax=Anguilla anguilla TaxID=7936 RepID=A0A0E9PCW4_ANGAN
MAQGEYNNPLYCTQTTIFGFLNQVLNPFV